MKHPVTAMNPVAKNLAESAAAGNSPPPKPQQVSRREELIRGRQSAAPPAQPNPAARGCGGCRGRDLKR
jgi:hypothetical protein